MIDYKTLRYLVSGSPGKVPQEPFELTVDQTNAISMIEKWVLNVSKTEPRFMAMKGYAGTGKTMITRRLLNLPAKFHFVAPTNKATKVLGSMLQVPVCTIYSLLGVVMTPEDESEFMALRFPEVLPLLSTGVIVVCDEAGMLSEEMVRFIESLASYIRFLFIGDPAQLPPVGEDDSLAFNLPGHSCWLREVKRFDDELLSLSVWIRQNLKSGELTYIPPSFNGGKIRYSDDGGDFVDSLLQVKDWSSTKVIAWRNKTVDAYNDLIRDHAGYKVPFVSGEPLLLASVIEGEPLGTVDQELTVKNATFGVMNRVQFGSVDTELSCTTLTTEEGLNLCIPSNKKHLDNLLSNLATQAKTADKRNRSSMWKGFWEVKSRFHKVRYYRAITAHRSQGSTFENVFLDQRDVLRNPETLTAYRCLYVGATRASESLNLY